MRRREYLRSAVGAAGLPGLATTVPPALGADDVSPSTSDRSPQGTGTTTTPSDEFEPLASVGLDSEQVAEAVTTPDGRWAFVATFAGFRVVDLADPASPEVVAGREEILPDEGPMGNLKDVKYNRGRLLVAADFNNAFMGIALFDARDPTDPALLGAYRTGYGVHNCDLHGEYAYLTARDELDVVSFRGEPESVATWSVVDYDDGYTDIPGSFRNLHDVYVQDGRAYLACLDAGTWILDVSDPADPAYVGHAADHSLSELQSVPGEETRAFLYEPPGNSHYVQPSDDSTVLAVGREAWNVASNDDQADDPGGPAGITLFDISDASDPRRLATIDPPPVPEDEPATRAGHWTTAHNFDIVGDYLYSSWYQGGVKVHDISDPAAPEERARWRDGETTQFWTAQAGVPGEYFVASNYVNPSGEADGVGLYVFPDPTDNRATVTPSGPTISTPTVPSTATPTGASGSPTPSSTPGGSSPGTAGKTDTTDATGPGFGPLAALAALGAGAWRLARGDE